MHANILNLTKLRAAASFCSEQKLLKTMPTCKYSHIVVARLESEFHCTLSHGYMSNFLIAQAMQFFENAASTACGDKS